MNWVSRHCLRNFVPGHVGIDQGPQKNEGVWGVTDIFQFSFEQNASGPVQDVLYAHGRIFDHQRTDQLGTRKIIHL